jgi:hypothetical protein
VEPLWESDWRLAPAAALAALGAMPMIRGAIRWNARAGIPLEAPRRNLPLLQAFRLLLGGGSLVAVGAGWYLQQPVLVAAGLVIGFEETLETSIAAWALARE